jgi:hypothetical protein
VFTKKALLLNAVMLSVIMLKVVAPFVLPSCDDIFFSFFAKKKIFSCFSKILKKVKIDGLSEPKFSTTLKYEM